MKELHGGQREKLEEMLNEIENLTVRKSRKKEEMQKYIGKGTVQNFPLTPSEGR